MNNERTADGKKYYYLFDGLGSIVGMTDSTGSEVNRYDYDPYGNMLNQQEQSGLNNPWKFAGGYLDSNTGLYHFGARYYDPSLGRWTQQDPVGGSLGDLGSANRYAYANDDPVNEVDPSGKLAGNCGTAILELSDSGIASGVADLYFTLETNPGWGSITAFVGFLTINDPYAYNEQLVVGGSSSDNFAELNFLYETGAGPVAAVITGTALLSDDSVCVFGASWAGAIA